MPLGEENEFTEVSMGLWNVLSPLSFLALPPCIHPAHQPTFKPNHLLSTVKSSFMMYLQPLLNLHSCHRITDSRSHHLNVRYYGKSHKWSPCLLCFSLSRILHASEGPIFLKYGSGNQPKITWGNILNIHTSRLSTICSKSVFLALVPLTQLPHPITRLAKFPYTELSCLEDIFQHVVSSTLPFFLHSVLVYHSNLLQILPSLSSQTTSAYNDFFLLLSFIDLLSVINHMLSVSYSYLELSLKC